MAGTNKLDQGGEEYTIKNIEAHEDYAVLPSGGTINDIAMIEIDQPFNFRTSPLIQPIAYTDDFVDGGVMATVSGYG